MTIKCKCKCKGKGLKVRVGVRGKGKGKPGKDKTRHEKIQEKTRLLHGTRQDTIRRDKPWPKQKNSHLLKWFVLSCDYLMVVLSSCRDLWWPVGLVLPFQFRLFEEQRSCAGHDAHVSFLRHLVLSCLVLSSPLSCLISLYLVFVL
jgi:hypothetical protein